MCNVDTHPTWLIGATMRIDIRVILLFSRVARTQLSTTERVMGMCAIFVVNISNCECNLYYLQIIC